MSKPNALAVLRLITSSNLVVRGHSGPTQQRHTGRGCAGSGCAQLFATCWKQPQAAWVSSVVASLVDAVTAVAIALSGAVCGELEAATGCWDSSVVAFLVDAVTAVGIALSGAVCGELDGDAVPCRLSGVLIAGEAGETIVESVVPGLRGTAAMTDLPSTLASWPAICRTRPLAAAIDPHMMKATASPAFRCKLDHRPDSGCTFCAERMANPCKRANL